MEAEGVPPNGERNLGYPTIFFKIFSLKYPENFVGCPIVNAEPAQGKIPPDNPPLTTKQIGYSPS